jgi:hypothetical protein
MKASIILPTIALFTTALAIPAPALLFTFSLSNDITGASATSSVVVNAGPVALTNIFPWASNLRQNGHLIATSASRTWRACSRAMAAW